MALNARTNLVGLVKRTFKISCASGSYIDPEEKEGFVDLKKCEFPAQEYFALRPVESSTGYQDHYLNGVLR